MEWLLSDDFASISNKKTKSKTPTQTDQSTVVTQRCRGQIAVNGLFIGEPRSSNLIFYQSVKVMDMEIFIPLALGVPEH